MFNGCISVSVIVSSGYSLSQREAKGCIKKNICIKKILGWIKSFMNNEELLKVKLTPLPRRFLAANWKILAVFRDPTGKHRNTPRFKRCLSSVKALCMRKADIFSTAFCSLCHHSRNIRTSSHIVKASNSKKA